MIICYTSPKYCHALSFVFSFLHLFCYRFSALLGMPHPSSHTNAVQMLLTLKMVGLALEVQDTAKLKREVAKLNAGDILNDNQGRKEGTSDDELAAYNFETIHNIEEYATEFYDVRGSLKSWNMTVQYWLAMNVYRRVPVKALRVTITMLVSAFWHGVHSGYYLSMLTVPFILVAEDLAKRKFRSLNPFVFDVFAGFAKVQWFSYMGIAFSLLAMDLTLNYWTSIYFIGHVAIIIVYAVSWIFPGFKVKSSE